ncbi:hypothetical protein [Kitasatospora sp. NPDC090091]|uniref:hypothetical protein n=1 Tax=Kitasatospora sp. NPDC090091 TaxID=3364081 RepID=UPI003813D7EA
MTAVDLPETHRRIGPLLGQPAWDVRRGIGSFVTMEFGEPLPPDRSGRVYGRWHLWIQMAAWRLETADRVLVGSEDQGLEEALTRLEGRPLTSVVIKPSTLETRFDFDGLRLETFPMYRRDGEEGELDHWLLWLGTGEVLVAGSELTVEPAGGDRAGRRSHGAAVTRVGA